MYCLYTSLVATLLLATLLTPQNCPRLGDLKRGRCPSN
jgi:hypothetical protein